MDMSSIIPHEQFLGLDTEEKIKKFIQKHNLKKETDYKIMINKDGKEEYVFRNGVYHDVIKSDPNHKHHQDMLYCEEILGYYNQYVKMWDEKHSPSKKLREKLREKRAERIKY